MGRVTPRWRTVSLIVRSFPDLLRVNKRFDTLSKEWVFRGEADAADLTSTIERCFVDLRVRKKDYLAIESTLFHEFRRYYHLYSAGPVPDPNDKLAYLALMRHYHAPARLLDFTYSLFIACYFAVERAKKQAIIWAVNKTWMTQFANPLILAQPDGEALLGRLYARDGEAFDDVYIRNCTHQPFVGAIGPSFMNDRIAVQKGLFLCATDLSLPFEHVLWMMPGSRENVVRIRLSVRTRPTLLYALDRMNITRAALFPGLEGFAESLYGKVLLFSRLEEKRRAGGRLGPRPLGI
jgi:hypothetical protein